MLKKFELSNYKNFENLISVDLGKVGGYKFNEDCIYNNIIMKSIIYGKNGTGKSNLGKAILDIHKNIFIPKNILRNDTSFLNANSNNEYAEFKYIFQFGSVELIYRYKKNSERLVVEEELILNDSQCYFINFETIEHNFENLSLLGSDTINVENFIESINLNADENEEVEYNNIAFLRWLINNSVVSPDSVLRELADFIRGMTIVSPLSVMNNNPRSYKMFFNTLSNEVELNKFENFLNYMGVACQLNVERLPEGEYQLYFKQKKLIPFLENASSGTLALTDLYRRITREKKASLLFLDEFDAFYHYEMSEKAINYFKEDYPYYQIIMTTHNTNLMSNRLMRPDCLMILSQEGKLTPLCNATKRELREGHSLEKMFINGEFMDYE